VDVDRAMSTEVTGAGVGGGAPDSIVLEEEIDPNYVPSEAEVVEYAKWLGMDLKTDQDLFWVAKEGLMAPLPKNWKPCKTKDTEDIYYFNFASGESTWDHPCDGYYKRLYEEEKKKKEVQMKESSDQVRTRAKQDVDQLLGKSDKKRKKKTVEVVEPFSTQTATKKVGIAALGPITTLEKKPLPGILPVMSAAEPSISSSSSSSLGRINAAVSSSADGKLGSVGTQSMSNSSSRTSVSMTPSSSTEFEPSEAKPQKSKKSSSLRAVIAESDAENKRETEEESPHKTVRRSSTPSSSAIPHESKAVSEAEPSGAEAKKSGGGGEVDSDIISKLRLQIRRLESDVEIKTRQCDRFESENAELERRLSKEKRTLKELRESFEDSESQLKKQLKNLNEEIADLNKQIDSAQASERLLRASNRELEMTNQDLKSATVSTTSASSSAGDDLLDKISKLESSNRRLTKTNADLEEQLSTQESQFKSKLATTQRRFDDLLKENELSKSKFQKCEESLQSEISNLRKTIKDAGVAPATKQADATSTTAPAPLPATAPVVVAVATSATEDMVPKVQFQQLTAELSSVKIERDDFANKCKRLELSIASWEGDCVEKESRLQQARSRANDLEAELTPLRATVRQNAVDLADANDKVRLLDMEKSTIRAEQADLRTKLADVSAKLQETTTAHEAVMTKQRVEMQSALDAEKLLNQQAEKKMRGFQEELLQLERRLQEVRDVRGSSPIKSSNAAPLGDLSNELESVNNLLHDAERRAKSYSVEADALRARVAALTERNAVLQAEADRLREMMHVFKASSQQNASPGLQAIETQLSAKNEELTAARALASSLRSQLDDMTRRWNELLEENKKLLQEGAAKSLALRDVEGSNDRVKLELGLLEKSAEAKTLELLQARRDEESERRARQKLESELEILRRRGEDPSRVQGHRNEGSIVELSIIVGKQQAIVAQLESKLLEAESTIKELGKPTQAPLKPSVPETVSEVVARPAHEESVAKAEAEQPLVNDPFEGLDKSILREMMLDFVRRRKPFHEGAASDSAPTTIGSKIVKEKKFIIEARKQLKDEKIAIRLEQNGLLKRREAWKNNRNSPLVGGVVKSKDVVKMLNKQTLQLNLAIEQARRTQQWLDEREKKLEKLEELVTEASFSNDSHEEFLAVGHLEKELDADATMIELEPFLPLQPSFHQSPLDALGFGANQENEVPSHMFFPEGSSRRPTNTYLQSKAEERARGGYSKAARPLSTSSENPPVVPSAGSLSNEDRRLLQGRIQKEVEERNRCMAAYHDHAG